MPCHQVFEFPQHIWWFQKSKGRIVGFETRDAAWDRRH
jgi:hypothetical protein